MGHKRLVQRSTVRLFGEAGPFERVDGALRQVGYLALLAACGLVAMIGGLTLIILAL